jgi:ABC-type amino acid transport substrate-binding protein
MAFSHRFHRRAAVAALALLGLSFGAVAQADDSLQRVQAKQTLVIGNGGAYPPFEFVENGKLSGYDIELGEELGRRMNLKVEWRVTEFTGLIGALTSKRVDMLLTAFGKTAERAQKIAFSEPYYVTGNTAAYKPGLDMRSIDKLAGKVIGVQAGSPSEKLVRDHASKTAKSIQSYSNINLALRDLEVGRVEVVVNLAPVLAYTLTRKPDHGLEVGPIWEPRGISANTRLEDKALLAEIDKQFAAMRADGFTERLNLKWFGSK